MYKSGFLGCLLYCAIVVEDHLILPPCMLASQLRGLTSVEITIIIVVDVKLAWVSTSKAIVNI